MNRRIRNRTYGGVRGGNRKEPSYSIEAAKPRICVHLR
jgi:hypothetical protein